MAEKIIKKEKKTKDVPVLTVELGGCEVTVQRMSFGCLMGLAKLLEPYISNILGPVLAKGGEIQLAGLIGYLMEGGFFSSLLRSAPDDFMKAVGFLINIKPESEDFAWLIDEVGPHDLFAALPEIVAFNDLKKLVELIGLAYERIVVSYRPTKAE